MLVWVGIWKSNVCFEGLLVGFIGRSNRFLRLPMVVSKSGYWLLALLSVVVAIYAEIAIDVGCCRTAALSINGPACIAHDSAGADRQ